jgi:ubiquinone/menaquinone biosynthesis C-methylase UbiE
MNWRAFWNDSAQVRDGDFCKQVGRTFNRVAYSEQQIEVLVARLLDLLEPAADKRLLDLACGNGLITSRLAPHFHDVTALDFSEPLIETAKRHFAPDNVTYVLGDAGELDAINGPYDCALVSAALQFFDAKEARRLLRRLISVVAANGRIVFGDVADRDRLWNFYRGYSGRFQYAVELVTRRPVIGHWWRASALRRLAHDEGWTASIHYQGPACPNHYFRYDAVLERLL